MDSKRRRLLSVAALASLAGVAHSAYAQPPSLKQLNPFQRVEADRGKDYQLKAQDGPWLIMAHAFSGEHAKADAHDLCLALRKLNHKAYVHVQTIDLGSDPEGIGFQVKSDTLDPVTAKKSDYQSRLQKKNFSYSQKPQTIYHTVFVGDFISADDPALAKSLKSIQSLKINLEKPDPDSKDVLSRIEWFRNGLIEGFNENGGKAAKKGPLGRAFAAINPLGDKPYREDGVVDDFVAQMNETKYSLLDNPGKYTVKVATFVGYDEWDATKIQDRIRDNDLNDAAKRLMKAAEKAEKLCAALRANDHEAYVFHDRTESVVAVGSFERYGDPRDDGKIEIDPAVHRVIKEFEAKPVKGAEATGAVMPRVFGGIACDSQPILVSVPRRKGDSRKRTASR
jgi:hypothetical protein